LLGYIRWYEEACQHANFLQMPRDATSKHHREPKLPLFLGSDTVTVSLGLTELRDMADVLSLLGPNKTLTFVGDSVASQHAYASECSW
jgi:hypothetical protein